MTSVLVDWRHCAEHDSSNMREEGGQVAEVGHCAFCFEVLLANLSGGQLPAPKFPDSTCALFVTWNKRNSWGSYNLRGCIGTLEPRRLHTALRDYALTSALRDSRFSPIALKEVSSLSVGVSLLRGFERAQDHLDWQVGVHGLIIEFQDPSTRSRRSATFLPEVARDQGWDQQQTLAALVKKAGYEGGLTPELAAALKVTRYQSSKASLAYADYLRWAADATTAEEEGAVPVSPTRETVTVLA